MRSIQLHLPSLAVGVAACALVLVSMSQAQPEPKSPPEARDSAAKNMVQIREGTPFTVPKDCVFVLTAIGTANHTFGGSMCLLKVNGELEVSGGVVAINAGSTALMTGGTVQQVAPGFSVPAGAKIEVEDQQQQAANGRAWGYLVK